MSPMLFAPASNKCLPLIQKAVFGLCAITTITTIKG
jgi:hypothetical protein